MKTIVTDTETNGLIKWKSKEFPSVIWCATTIELETGETRSFSSDLEVCQKHGLEFIDEYWKLLESADKVVGHNLIQYDRPVIAYHTGYTIPLSKIEDTLIYSRLLDPKRPEGHSLGYWGGYFGIKKPEHEDWSKFSPEMLHRNIEDTKINVKLYKHLKKEFNRIGFSEESYKVERNMAYIFYCQERDGFPLDDEFVLDLVFEIKDKAEELKNEITKEFPDLPDQRKTYRYDYRPKYKKSGELFNHCKKKLDEHGFSEDTGDCTIFNWRPFDIDSNADRIRHLLRMGWQPFEFTEKGSPQITEESLEVFDNPVAKKFIDYIILRNREKVLERWLIECDEDGFVHSPINQIGTWTHRCSHSNFFGNPPRVSLLKFKTFEDFKSSEKPLAKEYTEDKVRKILESKGEVEIPITGLEGGFGYECRKAWAAKGNDVQIGIDADGIQMRAFAHYIQDEKYVDIILNSDIHVYNQELAGLKTRNNAKTFIYAFLLGAGNHKVGTIYNMTEDEISDMQDEVMASRCDGIRQQLQMGMDYLNIPLTPRNYALSYRGFLTKNQFIDSLPGLKKLRQEAKQGWFTALDGRRILVKSKHLDLACKLQSFEQAVIKRANVIAFSHLTKLGIPYIQGNQIHDEYQCFSHEKYAHLVGETHANAITKAGEIYNSFCPLSGSYRLGKNWMECH